MRTPMMPSICPSILLLCILPTNKNLGAAFQPIHVPRRHGPSSLRPATSASSSSDFSSSSSSSSATTTTSLQYSSGPYYDEIESARAQLEGLVAKDSPAIQTRERIIAQAEARQMYLTCSGRRIRELEMELLRSLEDSDAGLEELVHLWTTERDRQAAADMLYMQEHCSTGLVLEEARLWEMTREYPGWAEPHARLAAVLYYKGTEHTAKAAEMALRALELKPWHFETLQLLVVISTSCNDARNALQWSQMALPALEPETDNARRKEWVRRALQEASKRWEQAELATKAIQKGYKPTFLMAPEFEEDSWQ